MRTCLICGTNQNIHRHHVYFGNGNRKISEKHGFVVDLCGYHHNQSNNGVHFDRNLDLLVKKHVQREYEKNHSRTEFIKLIGRNYLD